MDKAYRFYLAVSNKLLAGVLTLLGFSITSCGADDEYGSPYTTYEIKGKVVNEEGNAIPNIQVIIPAPDASIEEDIYIRRDTLLTNNSGEFNKQINDSFFGGDATIKIAAKDIDGEANGGSFEDTITEVDFKNVKKDVTITMKQAVKNKD